MINYTIIGEGEEIVFIHGLGNSMDAWIPQLSLSEQYRLIIVELRGHGNSTMKEQLTVEQYAKDILEVLEHENIHQAHICGLSLGGLVALEIFKQSNDKVKSLILSNTTFWIPQCLGELQVEKAKLTIEQIGFEGYKKRAIYQCLYNHQDKKIVELAEKAFVIRTDTYIYAMRSAFGRNYLSLLFSINVPTTIISSLEDRITPIQNSLILHSCIRNSNFISFNKTGHLSNIDNSIEFNEAIIEHIKHTKK